MADLFVLTEHDKTLLAGVLETVRRQPLNTPQRFEGEDADGNAPDVYVAVSPSTILANAAASVSCRVWRLLSGVLTDAGFDRDVWNPSATNISAGTIIIKRDKFGVWWAESLAAGGGGSGILTLTPGTAGTDFNIDATDPANVIVNLPDAGVSSRGVVTAIDQEFAGNKSLPGGESWISGDVATNGSVLGPFGVQVFDNGNDIVMGGAFVDPAVIPFHNLIAHSADAWTPIQSTISVTGVQGLVFSTEAATFDGFNFHQESHFNLVVGEPDGYIATPAIRIVVIKPLSVETYTGIYGTDPCGTVFSGGIATTLGTSSFVSAVSGGTTGLTFTGTTSLTMGGTLAVVNGGLGLDASGWEAGSEAEATGAGAFVKKRNNYAGGGPPGVNDDSGDGYSIGSTWVG